jgi:hypothetical protein
MSRLNYTVVLHDGTVYRGMAGSEIVKTVDKRSPQSPVEMVFEVRLPSGVVVKVWSSEVREWSGEVETHRAKSPSSSVALERDGEER